MMLTDTTDRKNSSPPEDRRAAARMDHMLPHWLKNKNAKDKREAKKKNPKENRPRR